MAIITLIMGVTNNCMGMQQQEYFRKSVPIFEKKPEFFPNNNVKKINPIKPSYQRTAFYGAAAVTCLFLGSLIYKNGYSVITQPGTIAGPIVGVGAVSAAVSAGTHYVYYQKQCQTE